MSFEYGRKSTQRFLIVRIRERIYVTAKSTNLAELVRHIHNIQNRFEHAAALRTARLERKNGPNVAYSDTTLARIVDVATHRTDKAQADTDQNFRIYFT